MEDLLQALRRMRVQTGGLVCMGCGHERSCGVHGCAILREAGERIEGLEATLAEKDAAIAKQAQELKAALAKLAEVARERDAAVQDLTELARDSDSGSDAACRQCRHVMADGECARIAWDAEGNGTTGDCSFDWRGVCAGNGDKSSPAETCSADG